MILQRILFTALKRITVKVKQTILSHLRYIVIVKDLESSMADSNVNCFYYFGYGSNLNSERLRLMNPSAEFIKIGKLQNYCLGFTGFSNSWMGASATIYPCEGKHVWGAIWKLSIADAESLDEQEGVHLMMYRREDVDVLTDEGSIACRTYLKYDWPEGASKPSVAYKHTIVTGAVESGLPRDYIEWLESIEHNNYNGPVLIKLKILEHLNALPLTGTLTSMSIDLDITLAESKALKEVA